MRCPCPVAVIPLTINVEEAGLSSCSECKLTQGKINIKMVDDKTINFSLTAVGPNHWSSYDTQEGMTYISNLILVKDFSKQ